MTKKVWAKSKKKEVKAKDKTETPPATTPKQQENLKDAKAVMPPPLKLGTDDKNKKFTLKEL